MLKRQFLLAMAASMLSLPLVADQQECTEENREENQECPAKPVSSFFAENEEEKTCEQETNAKLLSICEETEGDNEEPKEQALLAQEDVKDIQEEPAAPQSC